MDRSRFPEKEIRLQVLLTSLQDDKVQAEWRSPQLIMRLGLP